MSLRTDFNMSSVLLTMIPLSYCPSNVLTILRTHSKDLCGGVTGPFYKEFGAFRHALFRTPLPDEITSVYPHLRCYGDLAGKYSEGPRDYWGSLYHIITDVTRTIQAMYHCLDRVRHGVPCIRCSKDGCRFQELEERKIRFVQCGNCGKSWAHIFD